MTSAKLPRPKRTPGKLSFSKPAPFSCLDASQRYCAATLLNEDDLFNSSECDVGKIPAFSTSSRAEHFARQLQGLAFASFLLLPLRHSHLYLLYRHREDRRCIAPSPKWSATSKRWKVSSGGFLCFTLTSCFFFFVHNSTRSPTGLDSLSTTARRPLLALPSPLLPST